VITDKDDVLGTLKDWNQGLRLRRLGSLIDQDLTEAEVADSAIEGCDTSRADNISVAQDLVFGLTLQLLEFLLVIFVQLTLLLLA